METYTKEQLIKALCAIRDRGWIRSERGGNDGAVGNTLEDLLGIEENNLPIPNAAEWELKAQRTNTTSLTTLFHMEPSPTACKFVPKILLPHYGWAHQKAGQDYPDNEMSFRQTINAAARSDRGFCVKVDRQQRKVVISFDSKFVDARHKGWLSSVKKRVSMKELEPQPYWGFDDLFHKVGTKLHNCFFIRAQRKRENGVEFFHYTDILMLKGLSQDKFIDAIEGGRIYVDFDARTGHNHGTKFRIHKNLIPELYQEVKAF
ncbi:MAG TPA: MvaI/BcnI family restriction endonuclease [Gallionella sp.]|nr:MvaI/BcnI family restriction endonuclease [Gallionella sp.]